LFSSRLANKVTVLGRPHKIRIESYYLSTHTYAHRYLTMLRKARGRLKFIIIGFLSLLSIVSFLFVNIETLEKKVDRDFYFPQQEKGINFVNEIKPEKDFKRDILTHEPTSPPKVDTRPPIMDIVMTLFETAKASPEVLHALLEETDPLGVRIPSETFTCPRESAQLLDFPSIVNHEASRDFRDSKPGSWILYQHLRKAGGTGFCDLASSNMPRSAVPSYYCMPDNKGSLATPPWNDPTHTSKVMEEKGFRIAANEWDGFTADMAVWPGVVLATTIRHPVDRWFSQYRFEHLERRDGGKAAAGVEAKASEDLAEICSVCGDIYCEKSLKVQCMKKYYNGMRSWTMGANYYVNTFLGRKNKQWSGNKGDFYWTYHKYQNVPITWDSFSEALRNLRKFHLILVLEWIGASSDLIASTLGW
jgi:hypothetical protein